MNFCSVKKLLFFVIPAKAGIQILQFQRNIMAKFTKNLIIDKSFSAKRS